MSEYDNTAYWEAHFAQFEGMNLGPIPARPEGRAIPEPVTLTPIAVMVLATRRARRHG